MTHPKLQTVVTAVNGFMDKYPTISQHEKLRELEEKTGYPKAYFFVAAAALLSVTVLAVGGSKLIVDLVGFVYPAYMSFKSIDSAGSNDGTQWLTYWILFSTMSIVESMLGFVVNWIPLYFFFKIAIIVWLVYPTTRGAQTIYEQVLRPFTQPYLEKSSSGTTKKAE